MNVLDQAPTVHSVIIIPNHRPTAKPDSKQVPGQVPPDSEQVPGQVPPDSKEVPGQVPPDSKQVMDRYHQTGNWAGTRV